MTVKTTSTCERTPAKRATSEEGQYPICEPELKISSDDPQVCVDDMARREGKDARKITPIGDQASQGSFHPWIVALEALDLLSIGLAVTSASGHVLMANRTAEELLEARDGLDLTSSGVLTLAGSGPELTEFVKQALKTNYMGESGSRDTVLAVRRPSGKTALTLIVRRVENRSTNGSSMEPAALLFMLDPGLSVEAKESEMNELFGLTSSEARLANLLMEGKTLDQCCNELAIRKSTGRTHLKHLFEKVGVKRQTELIAVLLKTIGLVRTRNRDRRGESALQALSFGIPQIL